MKYAKRIASLLLALVMVLGMTTTVFAANVTNKTDHSYNAYQIFSGTQAEGSDPLGDVQWGTGIEGEAFLKALQDNTSIGYIFSGCSTAAEVADVLGGYVDESDVAKAFANVAANYLTDDYTTIYAGQDSANLDPGYYLLVDTTYLDEGDAMNSALLQVTDDITIEKKYDVPSVDKSVKDTDDDEWVEAADWEIGSDVPFQLVGTLPSNYDDYETYKYVFHDTLSAGLEYNKDVKVYVQNGDEKAELSDGFIVDCDDQNNLTVNFGDLKKIDGINADSKIIVEYTAKLTSDAVIGSEGNANKVYLEYSNNPNYTGDGTDIPTSNTPEDEVLVFTYELDVTKVDGKDELKTLPNAIFVLLNSDGTKAAMVDKNGKLTGWVDVTNGDEYPEEAQLVSNENGKFVIAGLDAGTYLLREIKAPAGYNLLTDDIRLIITAELDKSEDNPALEELTISVDDGKAVEGDVKTGIVSTQVENNIGATLPSTGGMGTTIFYVIGGLLLVCAAVLLVTKRRMSSEK